jgi:hypothetical protein
MGTAKAEGAGETLRLPGAVTIHCAYFIDLTKEQQLPIIN